jgi:hypothetical protein
MYDEIRCDAALPDDACHAGVVSAARREMHYGLASFRWVQPRSFLFDDDPDDDSNVDTDVGTPD